MNAIKFTTVFYTRKTKDNDSGYASTFFFLLKLETLDYLVVILLVLLIHSRLGWRLIFGVIMDSKTSGRSLHGRPSWTIPARPNQLFASGVSKKMQLW